jgi:4-hydroxybenzoate polyprenyltransferase
VNRSSTTPFPVLSAGFLRAYVVTMRPYLLFVSGATGLVGMSLVGGLTGPLALLLGGAFFLSYGFGQALTDCFQIDTDSISAPYRPLVRGAIRRRDVLLVSLVGLVGVGTILVAANPWNLPLVGAAIIGLATYTRFKRLWWAGPFYNAWIVAVLALTGVLAALGARSGAGAAIPELATLGTLLAVFFGYANFVLAGYFKDISADRATGYRTLPVEAGRRVAASVSDVFAALAVLGAILALAASPLEAGAGASHGIAATLLPLGLVTLGGLASLVAQVRLHAVQEDREAHVAVAPVVHAYVLLLAGIAAAYRPGWSPVLVLFLIAYWLTIRARPAREQI